MRHRDGRRAGEPLRKLGLATILAALVSAGFGGAVAVGAAPPTPTFTVVASPSPQSSPIGFLGGAACPTRSSCFAVGSYRDQLGHRRALVGQSSGGSWSIVPASPARTGATSDLLAAVACPTVARCFAVGYSSDGANTKTLIERWNGVTWSSVASPNPAHAGSAQLTGVTCPSATSCFAVGYAYVDPRLPRTLIERWNGAVWTVVPSPSPGALGQLWGVSCATANRCFAVGFAVESRGRSLVEQWNGKTWASVTDAPVAAPSATSLSAISCPEPTTCFAVGSSMDVLAGHTVTLVERWSGASWSIVPSPAPTPGEFRQFLGIACVSATSCLAVGGSGDAEPDVALAERWNGKAWSIVSTPGPALGVSLLNAISCVNASRCVAVGYRDGANTLVAQWNGRRFSAAPAGGSKGRLSKVSCSTQDACVAVGDTSDTSAGVIERWNGANWKIVAGPGANLLRLSGVTCATSATCFAVGTYSPPGFSGEKALIERRVGPVWSIAASPEVPAFSELLDVFCASDSSCDAVGGTSDGFSGKTLIEHWNGTTWSIVPSPSPATFSKLLGVSCASPTNCFAVGGTQVASGDSYLSDTLIERWDGTSWSVVDSPSPATSSGLAGVSCPTATTCFAVGGQGDSSTTSTLIEEWDGTSWSIVSGPSPAGTQIVSVSSATSSTCMAVGASAATGKTAAEKWNGTSWSVVPSPSSGTSSALAGVSCVADASCFAVGSYKTDISESTLVERYS